MAKCSKTISLLIQILLAERCVPHHWKVIYNISCKWIVEQKTVSIFWIDIHKRYSIVYSTTITILSIFVFPLLEHYWHYDLFYGYNGFVFLITEIWESSKHHKMNWEQLHKKHQLKSTVAPKHLFCLLKTSVFFSRIIDSFICYFEIWTDLYFYITMEV